MTRALWLALALTFAGWSAARADFKSLASPGPLADGHKDLDGQCDKCHVPFKGIPNNACLSCHTETQKRIAANRGSHAKWEHAGQKCSKCHTDHKGRNHIITPAVAMAGFDHEQQTGLKLDGKHSGVACVKCHKPGARGVPRWVGLPENCGGCHSDVHAGSLGPDCARCHATTGWKPPTKTIAQHKVPMTGKHEGLKCASCHARGAHLTASSLQPALRSAQGPGCGDCHDQKHGGTKAPCETCHNTNDWKSATFKHDFCTCILPGKHQTAACLACHPAFKFKPTPFACAACHKKDLKHEDLGACARCHSALSWKTKTFDHNIARVGFPLEGKHLEVGCENCHTKKGVFRGAPRDCEGCHKIPAHGDFGACAKCHVVAGFDKPSFSHDKTAFPLTDKHAGVGCQTCHARFKKGDFKPGPNACLLCHKDPHAGQFTGDGSRNFIFSGWGVLVASNGPLPHAVSARFGCTDCHTPRAWSPSTIDAAKHASFTYALKGKHETVACARCHDAGKFIGTPQTCSQCHTDRHRGRFAAQCERCHDEGGWRRPPGFDHKVATGFALEGSHDGLACAQCHGKDRQKLATVDKVTCATCHTPIHGNQFSGECTACHKTTRFTDVPGFNHSRTHFPLDRRHTVVKCTACHDARRGPRLETNCRFCHGDPHRGRTLLDCGECHRADRWTVVRFDHDRTIFPLRGRHFATPCRDCHTNDQYTGVRAECVSCHRGDRQRVDSELSFHRALSSDCAECHKAFTWKTR